MADLPPDIEAQLAACANRNAAGAAKLQELRKDVDELVDTLDGEEGGAADAIPEETFDDPSVVRCVQVAERTNARVRRASTPQPAAVHATQLRMRRPG